MTMEKTSGTSWQQSRSMIWNRIRTTCRTWQTVTSHRLLRRAAAVLLLTVGFGLITGSQAMAVDPASNCPGCDYRRSITVASDNLGNSCAADVSGFPVLVSIDSSTYLT